MMQSTNNVGFLLQHLAFVLSRHSDQVLQEQLGIGFSQFKILQILQENTHIQQRQIADELGQSEAGISRQIKLLIKQGIVVSNINPNNRREHEIHMTVKGERITDTAIEILNTYHAPTFQKLSPKQQKQFIDSLRIMHDQTCSNESKHTY